MNIRLFSIKLWIFFIKLGFKKENPAGKQGYKQTKN